VKDVLHCENPVVFAAYWMFNLFRRWGHHLLPPFEMVTSRSTDSRGTCSAPIILEGRKE